MNVLPETLDQLAARVAALEQRVHALEHGASESAQPAALPTHAAAFGAAPDLPSGEQVSSAFLLLGKSLLGIAGAYLLRALAESNALPRLLIAAVAIAYAIGWLVAAARARTKARWAAALFAGTSALILAPMLWELTMRFRVLTPVASAAVLGVFVVAATILTWREEHAPDLAIASGAAAGTALALSIATHEMMAFLALLLAMLAICEYKLAVHEIGAVRILVAAVSDCAVWFLIVIYRTPPNTRPDYPALGAAALAAPASLLFFITAVSVVFTTAVLRRRILWFQTTQSVIAFLLWVLTVLFLVAPGNSLIVGMVCLVFAGSCYATAYRFFRRAPESRNFHVFALWSAGLFLAALWLTLPIPWAIVCVALAAAVSAAFAVRIRSTTLECHGIVYLTVAAFAAGLPKYAFQAIAGTTPAHVAWSIFLVAGCALLCYALAREGEGERWQLQLLHLTSALIAVCAVTALTAHSAMWLAARVTTLAAFHIAFVRAFILCAIALILAFAGSRWRRLELSRLAYAGLALIAAKLVYEDLHHGHMGYIAASIFLFALTLIGVPRLARPRTPSHS